MSAASLFEGAGARAMRAVRIGADFRVEVIEAPEPEPGAGEIVVKPAACGICGTDLHILHHGFPGTSYPVVPGHEFAGTVAKVGRGVTTIREGDFVAVDPNVVCGACRWCRAGRPNLCLHLSPIGVGRPGAAAELVAAPAGNAYRVPEALGGPLAALIEPLACVMHAVSSSGGVANRTVLVLGGGTMGQLIAVVCGTMGAARVVLADPSPHKRAIAAGAGISETADPAELGADAAFDVVFEAAGVRAALAQALSCVEKTGTLVQVGVHDEHATAEIVPFKVYEREIRIVGSNSLADKFGAAVEMMPQIAPRARALLGESFAFTDFSAAVAAMGQGLSVKTQLRFD